MTHLGSLRSPLVALVAGLLGAGCSGSGPGKPTDAGPTSCGLPLPGTRCTTAATLERCQGTSVQTVDCAGEGRLCGADPAGTGGSACIRSGDACGLIPFDGECDGPVLAICLGSQLGVLDCTTVYGVCGASASGADCLPGCEVSGQALPASGVCANAHEVLRCGFADGGFFVEHVPCPTGTTCQFLPETAAPGCVFPTPCSDIGPQGLCTGDVLSRCVAGAVATTDCSNTGQVCSYGGSATGYGCQPPGTSGALGVSGTIRYEDRVVDLSGVGPRIPRPARGVTLAVVADGAGEVLASALTADDGSYAMHFDAPPGITVHLLAATTSSLAVRPVTVLLPDGLVHGFGGASFAPSAASVQDLLVTDDSGEAEAFNIFDDLVVGMDSVKAWLGLTELVPLTAAWARGADLGTYFQPSPAPPSIVLEGSLADDDGYDDAVILHEFGHYVEQSYTRLDSPGGPHGNFPVDPALAWSEGFANWVSSATRGNPLYVDTFIGGIGFTFDLESDVTRADPAGPMTQEIAEGLVGETLWDASDAPAGDDDPLTGASPAAVVGVARTYFLSTDFLDRGVAGADFVDWLDGWLFLRGTPDCDALRAIVATAHGFPYDFARPGAICP